MLMHVSSLPGDTGIGTLGASAYAFVDFLSRAGQRYWQVLPLGPTGFGDSPYQCFSTFAGNPYFIDLDALCADGYLAQEEYKNIDWGGDARVDYGLLYERRMRVFDAVLARFKPRPPEDFSDFCEENAAWLDDYALFAALKDAHGGAAFDVWDMALRRREPAALAAAARQYADGVLRHKMLQYFFFKQWRALKRYANDRGVRILGDLPIYVAGDSADVWSNPSLFRLDGELRPVEVAGCPPDAFSADGQLWGNPVYDWTAARETGYAWWIARLRSCLELFDAVRIDHFRGFDSYYCIPAGAASAREGVWREGPGYAFFEAVRAQLPDLPLVAEDLGSLTESVHALRKRTGFPGMRVLQFAFGGDDSAYLPHNHERNCVVYIGTHDNDTLAGWFQNARADERERARRYLGAENAQAGAAAMLRAAAESVADTAVFTMQDLLALRSEARMNTPATVGGNWCWRATREQLSPTLADRLRGFTELYGRRA